MRKSVWNAQDSYPAAELLAIVQAQKKNRQIGILHREIQAKTPKTITPPALTGGATMGSGGRLSKVPNGAQLFIGAWEHATIVFRRN
ncbi:MAG TPA: hypothetical protein VN175_10720 [Rhizomicrobium sp.]|nr:hypothetical protein [Rhizomicrobium sp.]